MVGLRFHHVPAEIGCNHRDACKMPNVEAFTRKRS